MLLVEVGLVVKEGDFNGSGGCRCGFRWYLMGLLVLVVVEVGFDSG